MKKVALSLLAFALVGGAAFADATADVIKSPVTFSLDVSASASWGYDLDTGVHGFSVNGGSKALTLWFANGSTAKTGDGDVHGYINVADVKFGYDDVAPSTTLGTGSIGDVTAKIVAGDLYVKISTNTDPSIDYYRDADNDNGGAGTSANDTFYTYSANYGGTSTEWNYANYAGISSFAGQGIEIGYSIPKLVSFTVGVASAQSWAAAKQTDYEESIAVGLLAVEKLTLEGKFYNSTDVKAAGATLGYDLGVVAPFADVNFNVTKSTYYSDFGLSLPLADGLKSVVWASYDDKSVVNTQATISLASGKLAGPLSLDAGVYGLNVTKQSTAVANLEVFAKVGLKATDTLALQATVDAQNDNVMFFKAQAEYTGISLTTLGVYYDSSDLGSAKSTGTSKLGKVGLTAKVAY